MYCLLLLINLLGSSSSSSRCSDGKSLPVEDIKTLIMVLEPEKPTITLDAARVVEEEEHHLVRGGKIFHNLTISAFTRTEAGEQTYVDDKVR